MLNSVMHVAVADIGRHAGHNVVVVLPAVMRHGDVFDPLEVSSTRRAECVEFHGEERCGIVVTFIRHHRGHGTSETVTCEIKTLGCSITTNRNISLNLRPEVVDLNQKSAVDKTILGAFTGDAKIGLDVFHAVGFGASKGDDNVSRRFEAPALGVAVFVELTLIKTKSQGLGADFFLVKLVAFTTVLVGKFSENAEHTAPAVEVHLRESVVRLFRKRFVGRAAAKNGDFIRATSRELSDLLSSRRLLTNLEEKDDSKLILSFKTLQNRLILQNSYHFS